MKIGWTLDFTAGNFSSDPNQGTNLQNHPDNNWYTIERPAISRVPFVFNSPHSGRYYTEQFILDSKLDSHTLRRSEDFLVDELFASVVPLGAPQLMADFPRAWLDVNREPYELDPKMFDGLLPGFVNSKSARVAGGLGTIARIVSEKDEIYRGKLSVEEGLARIENYYKPYHAALRGLLAEAVVEFGFAVLVDCHSMPSANHLASQGHASNMRADFVIGDRYGSSCSPRITEYAAEFLRELGYNVAINKPYAGGFITEHYGRPENGLHAIQIEINRALYMDEAKLVKNRYFDQLQQDLELFCSRLVSIPETGLEANISLAAE